QGGAAEDVPVLRLVQFLADERGTFETDLHRAVTAALQPVSQPDDLRRTPGTIRALHDDQLAREPVQINVGDAVSVKAAVGGAWHGDGPPGWTRNAAGDGSFFRQAHSGRLALPALNAARSIRAATSSRTRDC